jgi:hypothetical protein
VQWVIRFPWPLDLGSTIKIRSAGRAHKLWVRAIDMWGPRAGGTTLMRRAHGTVAWAGGKARGGMPAHRRADRGDPA